VYSTKRLIIHAVQLACTVHMHSIRLSKLRGTMGRTS